MNIDVNKIEEKIYFMEQNLLKLKKLREVKKDIFLEDFRNVDSAKYLLQVTIEAMLDISSHIIARNRWGKPEDNKAHFQMLADNQIIETKDIDIYFSMAKFRNRIVHMYFKIEDEFIYEIVQNNLEDFQRFITNIVKVIKN
ncbi:uncharacterized protein YutE (UPF0331/DUF86 family) [Clostridium punense]|uniref:Uncharacterized protein YutE (UPF0331/DUF86 family) n=1 Tax=Clostridium punense TaxID=1054297 RepID=A0ABS4K5X3_9CLOT|nr:MULTISPECIES: DUF86 domain-containing protein [Clostridium]EQB86321.1 hypothetical protein M918_15395 [Clostridium sp. BL8]MBP2022680.1 uncharacterized protein YutE (UPF0331/DUF86 family) [Clostridium punense]